MKIRARATYEIIKWDDDDSGEYSEERGYTDPNNPYGGLKAEVPHGLCGEPFTIWRDENADVVEFDNAWEAAEFVAHFPGGVWDYREGGSDEMRPDGSYLSVTLHIVEHEATVFALADIIEKSENKKLMEALK